MARQARQPGRFIRSKKGTVARVRKTRFRDAHGHWLYKLEFLPSHQASTRLFTLEELKAMGVRWFTRQPRKLNPM